MPKAVCPSCRLRPDLCYCRHVIRRPTSVQVVLVTHASEDRRNSNTGRLLEMALDGCRVMRLGAKEFRADLASLKDDSRFPLLLYPEASAPVLSAEFAREIKKPIRLIVPDGTWSQAKRIAHNHPEFFGMTRISLPPQPPSRYRLRRRGKSGGVCTAEAVACALGILENPQIEVYIRDLLDLMVGRVLWGRSTSAPFPAGTSD